MKNVYRIWALLLIGAILFSCAKETLVDKDAIAGEATASITGDGSDNGEESGENGGNGGDSNGGEDATPAEKPEFIDNNDWSAYDENEYLIGFGAVDETDTDEPGTEGSDEAAPEGSKATIDLSTRKVAWESADEATVYVPATGASGTYAYDATRGQFRPKTAGDVVAIGNNLAYVYYPSSLFSSYSDGTATVTMPGPVAVGNVNDLGEKLPMSGIIPANQGKAYPTVTFRNLGSVLRVQLTGCEKITSVTLSNTGVALAGSNAGSVTWSGGTAAAVPTLAMSGDTKSVTVSCGEGGLTLNESTPTEFYFLLPSSGTMSSMKVRVNFTQSDDTYEYTPYIEKTRSSGLALASNRNKIIKLSFRAGFFSGGKGTEADPYQIATPADFSYLQRACSGYGVSEAQYGYNATAGINYFRGPRQYLQTADIDFDGTSLGVIGSASYPFFGSYDGDGNTISNAVISDNSYWVGLFGYVDGGTIEDLTVSGCSVSSSNKHSDCSAGVLAGKLVDDATVSGCTVVSSTVTGVNCGGLVGYMEDGMVSECIARGVSVTAANTTDGGSTVNSAYCGGIAGCIKDGSVNSCSLYGAEADGTGTASSITGVTKVGGIAGIAAYDSGTSDVTACYASNATITASGSYAGGQVGCAYAGNSFYGREGENQSYQSVNRAKGAVLITAGGDFAGGILGYNAGSVTGYKVGTTYIPLITSVTGPSHNVITVSGTSYVGGIVGGNSGTMSHCYCNSLDVLGTSLYIGGIVGANTGTMTDCINRYMIIKAYDSSTSTYGDFVGGICGRINTGGSLNNSAWTASSLGITISGGRYVGGVVGQLTGSGTMVGSSSQISNESNNTYPSSISATGIYAGGVVGHLSSGTVSNFINGAPVSGTTYTVGGIIGHMATGRVTSCVNTAVVSTSSYNVGGIVGAQMNGVVEKCRNTANVSSTGGHCVGGVAGRIQGGAINLCYTASTATVTGLYMVGGLAGYAGQTETGHPDVYILNSASRAAVTSTGASGSNCCTGGLVGYLNGNNGHTTSVDNCVNLGENLLQSTNASAYHSIGGIAGYVNSQTNTSHAYVRNCYSSRATGRMKYMNGTAVPTTSGSRYGGVYGSLAGTGTEVIDCYYRCNEAGYKDANAVVNHCNKITQNQMTAIDKLSSIEIYTGRKVSNYLRVALAYGASTLSKTSTDTVSDSNLRVITISTGETIKTYNWLVNDDRTTNPSRYIYTVPKPLYDLGVHYYDD